MKNTWFTSDQHWGHSNIIKLCNRPFSSVEEMDEKLITLWNENVQKFDIVYHLGDMFWTEKKAIEILPRLNGEIHLVLGNHDSHWKRVYKRLNRSPLLPNSNLIVEDNSIVELQTPTPIVLCHYPMMDWDGKYRGYIHLHGHSHEKLPTEGNRINVSVENTEYKPINLSSFL